MYASLRRIVFLVVLSTTLLLSLRVVNVRAEEAADDYYTDDGAPTTMQKRQTTTRLLPTKTTTTSIREMVTTSSTGPSTLSSPSGALYSEYDRECISRAGSARTSVGQKLLLFCNVDRRTRSKVIQSLLISFYLSFLNNSSNNKDVILFQVFENGYNHCTDDALGTYITSVPEYMLGYLAQKEQDTEDQGYEYEEPEVAQYAYCTPFEIENQMFYFQLGCADDTTEKLAVNIYTDNTCTTRSAVDGYDDSNIDVSAIQVMITLSLFCKCSTDAPAIRLDSMHSPTLARVLSIIPLLVLK